MTRPAHVARIVAVAALLAAYAVALGTASAQPRGEALVHALARTCVGEANWVTVASGDCAAITHLLRRRAALLGISELAMVRAYSGRHVDPTRTDRRRWVAGLRLDGRRPAGWRAHLRWSRYRARWLAVVAHVRGVLRGSVADPCGGVAEHWGASGLRREDAGWSTVDCGATRNVFWRTGGGDS